jgi:hypothetical protein
MVSGGGTTIDVPNGHPSPPGDGPMAPAVRPVGVGESYRDVVAVEDLSPEVVALAPRLTRDAGVLRGPAVAAGAVS